MGRHSGKVALVTGGAQGIGLSIANTLASEGSSVAIIDSRPREQAQPTFNGAQSYLYIEADISDERQVIHSVKSILSIFGTIDILVNNAGISPKHNGKKVEAALMSIEEWKRVLDVNLTGTFLMCRAVIQTMSSHHWGRIINISSQAGRTGAKIAGSHYAASKAGIIGFSRTLALELGPRGITVNCIAPGRIRSAMTAEAPETDNLKFLAGTPLGRFGDPSEIAALVSFLASEDASFITGATIDINGGSFTC